MSSLEARKAEIKFELHAKQGVAIETIATEVLYGGAAGAGKSLLMRAAAIMWCGMIPGLQVYLFRRLRDDLVKNHIEGPQGLRMLLAPWSRAGLVDIVEDEIRFWNGSKIYLCHCKDEKDRFKYLGAEIHVLLIDELTTFTDTIYRFLRSRVRMAGITLPDGFEGRFPRILCGSNPGNVGHGWVKAAFIDARPPLKIERVSPAEGGMLRQFIPAKLADNPSLDPVEYGEKLEGLGSPALVQAMRDGDWNVVAGAFFPEFSTDVHVISPRSLPAYWQRFRAFDWGSARPFSVGWYAVSDGELPEFPRGALIRYREWYGAAKDSNGATVPNTGLRLTAEEIADGITEREKDDVYGNRVMGGVADPSIFSEDGGPSHADRMAARKVFFRPADNARVARLGAMGGWDQVRARLKGDGERPALFIFSTCLDLIRTLPALQHDDGRPEDVQTEGEDHAADECLVASTLVMTAEGEVPISMLRVGDLVQTRIGYRETLAVFSNGERPVFTVTFSNGDTLTGTANHPVWVEEIGFIPLSDLRYGDRTRPCSSLSSMKRSRSSRAEDITNAETTSSGTANGFTGWFGAGSMGAFHAARTFITETITSPIMSLQIWCVPQVRNTFPIMGSFVLDKVPSSSSMPGHLLPHGTDLKRALSGIANITSYIARALSISGLRNRVRTAKANSWDSTGTNIAPTPVNPPLAEGPKQTTSLACASYAAQSFSRISSRLENTVPSNAPTRCLRTAPWRNMRAIIAGLCLRPRMPARCGVRTVVSEPTIAGRQKVFNLSVAEAEEYFANGILVHNCRYACASRPYTAPLPVGADEAEPDKYARRWKPSRGNQRRSVRRHNPG